MCFFHNRLCGYLALLSQFQTSPVSGAIAVFPVNHSAAFQFCQNPGDGSLVFFTNFAQTCCGNALGVLFHSQQALGMRTLQSILCHFHPLNFLNIMIHAGNGAAQQLISVFHPLQPPFVVISTF